MPENGRRDSRSDGESSRPQRRDSGQQHQNRSSRGGRPNGSGSGGRRDSGFKGRPGRSDGAGRSDRPDRSDRHGEGFRGRRDRDGAPSDRQGGRSADRRSDDRSYRGRDDRPRRDNGPQRSRDDRPYRGREDRKQGERQGGERRDSERRDQRPYQKRDDRPYQKRDDRSDQRREGRPYQKRDDRPYQKRDDRSDQRREGRPYQKREGRPDQKRDDRPYQKREGRPYQKRDERQPRPHRDRDRDNGPRTSRTPNSDEAAAKQLLAAPALPEDIDFADLDPEARRELRSLHKELAESVGRHLVAAGTLLDEDPAAALEHARYAKSRASRIAVVREAVGLAAYHAGNWSEALSELRAVRRMTRTDAHVAVIADAERAMGRPERALDIAKETDLERLPKAVAVELAIVSAGARRDLGQLDAAVVGLQSSDLDPKKREPWSARLFYAYADNLAAVGRNDEAVRWFLNAAEADDDEETDAAGRAEELADQLADD